MLNGYHTSVVESRVERPRCSLIILFNNCLTKGSCVCIWMDDFSDSQSGYPSPSLTLSYSLYCMGNPWLNARPVLADVAVYGIYGIAICVDSGASGAKYPCRARSTLFHSHCIVCLETAPNLILTNSLYALHT